jgi:hypothetical protein
VEEESDHALLLGEEQQLEALGLPDVGLALSACLTQALHFFPPHELHEMKQLLLHVVQQVHDYQEQD